MRIYFDHNATTPTHPKVQTILSQNMEATWGNPSSLHQEGRMARHTIEEARKKGAALLSAKPEEFIFTSGGTEGNNSVIWGMFLKSLQTGEKLSQIISSPLEHPSVRMPLLSLQELGYSIHFLKVNQQGQLDVDDLKQALQQTPTALVSLSLCNHEIGNIYPIAEMAKLAHECGAAFHCDAVQAVGRIPVSFPELGIDFLTCSAHKIYGPKGVGALVVRDSSPWAKIPSFLQGGGQEKSRRAGTENGSAFAAFGMACELAQQELPERMKKTEMLRDLLETQLLQIPQAVLYGHPDPKHRAPGTCNIGFAGVEGELLMMNLDLAGISVSTGAACSSGSLEPSSVILGLGFNKEEARRAVRFSLGYENTEEQVHQVVSVVTESVNRIRNLSR